MTSEKRSLLDELLTLLGAFLFLPEEKVRTIWRAIPPQRQSRLCAESVNYELQVFFYYYLFAELTEEQKKIFLPAVRAVSAKTTRQIFAKETLQKLFQKNQIRFLLIKGAFLASEIYPDPLLRHMVDLDILIHPDDMEKTRKRLKETGWSGGKYLANHHYAPYYRNSVMLEIHQEIPDLPESCAPSFWETQIRKTSDGNTFLSPELVLLLLASHTKRHFCHNALRMLLDLACLIRSRSIDWNKAAEYAAEWNLPPPNLFFAYAPELFQFADRNSLPPDLPTVEPQEVEDFKFLLTQASVYSEISWDQLMVEHGFLTLPWWKERMSYFRLDHIRHKYHLNEKHSGVLLVGCFMKDFVQKGLFFLTSPFSKKDSGMQEYLKRRNRVAENIEEQSRKSRTGGNRRES